MGNVIEAALEVGAAALGASEHAKKEIPSRMRRAAVLSFGIYDPKNDDCDRPLLPSDTVDAIDNDVWNGNGSRYEWTDNMHHHSQFESAVCIKYSIHFIETQVGTLMLWITFRGTVQEQTMNWIANTACALVPSDFCDSNSSVKVHAGFQLAYMSVRSRLIRDIGRLDKGIYSITVVGHSLGGALAANCAFDILNNDFTFDRPKKVEVISFGAPAVGNQAFQTRFAELTANKKGSILPYCLVNKFDPVPYSLDLKASVAAPAVEMYSSGKSTVCKIPLVHASTPIELDTHISERKKSVTNDDNDSFGLMGAVGRAVIDQHSGPFYIDYMENFLASRRGTELFAAAVEASNFGEELAMSKFASQMRRN